MWDRSEQPVSEFLTRFNAAMKIADPQQREAALNAAQATAPPAFQRVYLGKTPDQATSLSLADARGKPRLTLTVDATGNPRIEFLDQNGKVTKRVP